MAARGKASGSAAPAAGAAPAEAADTLVARAESAAGGGAAKKRRLGRRGTDEAVTRALEEHFKEASSVETDLIIKDGKSLRQRIADDRRAAKAAGTKLGSTYWLRLRRQYDLQAVSGAITEVLVVKNKEEPVSQELADALAHARTANVTKKAVSRLCSFLQSCGNLNQREVVGLLRAVREMRPQQANGLEVIRQTLAMLVRTEGHVEFATEVSCLADLWDEALSGLFVSGKKLGLALHRWWEANKHLAGIILSVPQVERVLEAKGDWADVAEDLTQITCGSRLGAKMFAFAHTHVSSQLLQKFVDGLIRAAAGQVLDQEWLTKSVAAALKEADRLQAKDSSGQGRQKHIICNGNNIAHIFVEKNTKHIQQTHQKTSCCENWYLCDYSVFYLYWGPVVYGVLLF